MIYTAMVTTLGVLLETAECSVHGMHPKSISPRICLNAFLHSSIELSIDSSSPTKVLKSFLKIGRYVRVDSFLRRGKTEWVCDVSLHETFCKHSLMVIFSLFFLRIQLIFQYYRRAIRHQLVDLSLVCERQCAKQF